MTDERLAAVITKIDEIEERLTNHGRLLHGDANLNWKGLANEAQRQRELLEVLRSECQEAHRQQADMMKSVQGNVERLQKLEADIGEITVGRQREEAARDAVAKKLNLGNIMTVLLIIATAITLYNSGVFGA